MASASNKQAAQDGATARAPAGDAPAKTSVPPDLGKEQELSAFRQMLLIRRFEEKAGQLYGTGLIGGFCHLYIGQEAVVVGMQMTLKDGDEVITSYRDHGHMLACAMDPKGVMAELTGRRTGYSKGKGGSMHMFSREQKFFRLAPGREVRLRSASFITCTSVVKDESGNVVELRATYDPATRGGDAPDGRKPKATLHWVSAEHAIDCEVRLYDRLFKSEDPEAGGDFLANLNPDSLQVIPHAKLEPSVRGAAPLSRYQFERLGYFCVDRDSGGEKLVFNRTATLKDTFGARASRPQ